MAIDRVVRAELRRYAPGSGLSVEVLLLDCCDDSEGESEQLILLSDRCECAHSYAIEVRISLS